ncbi:hypothetical protein F4054_02020 [Candidatus Poribacteria bacterium]|nr:hypothetical protein [Candidatus Poribacteria bacterium]MYG07809.1 hypothetical protein [Candidatus Poribacteria bacterium]MYK21019.1 hypothetical protein [Candidatus Poribacteria bacterium]
MVDPNSPYRDEKPLIRRGRVDSLDIYEVKEHELELLEKGQVGTLLLNLGIFLFSIAFTCIAALATADFRSPITETIFIFIIVVGILGGLCLILIWWKTKQSIRKVVSIIRNRLNGQVPDVQTPGEPETQPKKPEDSEEPNG